MNKRQKTYALVSGGAAALAVLGIVVYAKTKGSATTPATPAAQTTPAASTNPAPNGLSGTVTMSDGPQSISVKIGTQIAIALPTGGAWVSLTSAALNGSSILGVVPAGSTQPVPWLVGASDTWTGVWRDASGATHTGTVSVSATAPQLAA